MENKNRTLIIIKIKTKAGNRKSPAVDGNIDDSFSLLIYIMLLLAGGCDYSGKNRRRVKETRVAIFLRGRAR
jgi:hypothetical protein